MIDFVSIRSPEVLQISNGDAGTHYGANQMWYPTRRQRASGCGPTACANLIWYLAATREACKGLRAGGAQTDMLGLMQEMWRYVTPGFGGVNSVSIFLQGALRFGEAHGTRFSHQKLELSNPRSKRAGYTRVFHFLEEAFARDVPVAFLNLSKGALSNLEGWHWVTLVAADTESGTVQAYDQGLRKTIDLSLWLRSAMLGGGLVALYL